VTETDRWRQHGDDVGAAVGVGLAQLGVERARIAHEVGGAVDDADVDAPGAEALRRGRSVRGAVDEVDAGVWGVVRGHHAGRARGAGGRGELGAEQLGDGLRRDPTGAEDLRGIDRAVDDRALDANRAGTAVEDDVRGWVEDVAELVEDVAGRGRADCAVAVGRRRRQAATRARQHVQRSRMGGDADADGVAAARDDVADAS
jgi:hypothetical protein